MFITYDKDFMKKKYFSLFQFKSVELVVGLEPGGSKVNSLTNKSILNPVRAFTSQCWLRISILILSMAAAIIFVASMALNKFIHTAKKISDSNLFGILAVSPTL